MAWAERTNQLYHFHAVLRVILFSPRHHAQEICQLILPVKLCPKEATVLLTTSHSSCSSARHTLEISTLASALPDTLNPPMETAGYYYSDALRNRPPDWRQCLDSSTVLHGGAYAPGWRHSLQGTRQMGSGVSRRLRSDGQKPRYIAPRPPLPWCLDLAGAPEPERPESTFQPPTHLEDKEETPLGGVNEWKSLADG
jgi:hypothetical protein